MLVFLFLMYLIKLILYNCVIVCFFFTKLYLFNAVIDHIFNLQRQLKKEKQNTTNIV